MRKIRKIFNHNPFPVVSVTVWLVLLTIIILGSQFYDNKNASAVVVDSNFQPTTTFVDRLRQTEDPAPTLTVNIDPVQQSTPVTPEAITTTIWPVQAPYLGIWISQAELALLPVSGTAWENLKTAAGQDLTPPDLSDLSNDNNVYILAKALVYARTGLADYQQETMAGIEEAMGTERGGETLALGRNLVAYIIAADLVNLPEANPALDDSFRVWLSGVLIEEMEDGRSLQQTHEIRPNNWGTHAGASRAAVALYLGDSAELARTAEVFKGWLGDRTAYTGFEYGRRDWQADPDNPVGINPPGASKEGHNIGGALPEEMRRAGRFRWPPRDTGYPWEGLQGAIVLAELLSRAGYPAWDWEEQALLRAVEFLYEIGWPAEGDDEWQIWLINHAYGTNFPAETATNPGKNMGWTDWTFGSR
jgi:hypothetical protein